MKSKMIYIFNYTAFRAVRGKNRRGSVGSCTYPFVYVMHHAVRQGEVYDHEGDSKHDKNDCNNVKFCQQRAFHQDVATYGNANDTRRNARNILADIDRMAYVNEEMTEQCKEHSEPESVENIAGKIVCQKAQSEEWDELLIDCQRESFIGKSSVGVHDLRESFEQIRVLFEEPAESGELFHVVENEYQWQ